MKIAFVTNICPHYRVGAFETLSKYHDVDFYFFSDGREKHRLIETGLHGGAFNYRYLRGFRLFGHRITPTLIMHLIFRNYDMVIKCTNGRFALPVAFLIARLLKRRFVLWHTFWHDRDTFFHRRLALPVYHCIWREADAIVTYGVHGKRYLERHGIDGTKIYIAWQAVNNPRYARPVGDAHLRRLRQKFKLEEMRVVLFVGRLEMEKGIEYLIDAFKRLDAKNSVLMIVGRGEAEMRFQRLCRAAHIEARVRFVGYVKHTELYQYYAMADMLVLPSITTRYFKEPWGLVVNEAMNQAVPVIVTEAVGAAAGGLVVDGVNGFVVKERDSQAVRTAIDTLLPSTKKNRAYADSNKMNTVPIMTLWRNLSHR